MTTNNEIVDDVYGLVGSGIRATLEFRAAPGTDEKALGASASDLRQCRSHLLPVLEAAGEQDLDTILKVEWTFLTQEHEYLGEAPIRTSSLGNAIEELDAAVEMLAYVRDKSTYQQLDRYFSLEKNRKNNLPYDQARQFFESHKTRLSNIERASMDEDARDLLAAREANLERAKLLYMELQQQALADDSPDEVREPRAIYAARLKAA